MTGEPPPPGACPDDAAALRGLCAAVAGYLDNPGCNINTRKQALEKLRWALEIANLKLSS